MTHAFFNGFENANLDVTVKPIGIHDVSEGELHKYTTEASTLGWKPGEWPKQIDTTLGNCQPFIRKKWLRDQDNDLYAVVYWQAFSAAELHVLND